MEEKFLKFQNEFASNMSNLSDRINDHFNTLTTWTDSVSTDWGTGNIDWNEYYRWRQPYDYTVPYQPFDYQCINGITYIIEKPKKEKKNMKNFYHVFVVDLDEKILVDEKVVAKNEDDAKFLAKVFSTLEEAKLKPTEVTIIVNLLGNVKVRPKTKEVIVKKPE